MEKEIKKLINQVKEAAKDVYEQLGNGWKEEIYQKAMEVALRERGISYETQRMLPITYADHVIGDAIPDLVVWFKNNGKKLAIVIDLKWEPGIKDEHRYQVQKYIQELKKQVRKNEEVYSTGFVINFIKESTSQKLKDGVEELGGVQVLEVSI
jgi:GxxExxY protein